MPLTAGTKIGPYEITGAIGAGGMGEVYRARDTKLKRDVALKVLPEAFARDPERMARFQREAEVLASLNHPNIASIFGLEGGVENRALVMEFVEGGSPAGPMPFDEAWHIASQIAAALEYAHERGVVHRDLKPANLKVTPDGVVKLLDFGLAKAFSNQGEGAASSDNGLANSPTLTISPTRAGMILGTAAYMAPEQARGKSVDKRADIWAFGCVFYELLTGEKLFQGEDVADTLAQVLTKQPDWEQVPLKARPLLQGCLQKDPKQRLRDIGDAKWLLRETAPQTVPAARSKLPVAVAAAAIVVAALALGGFAYFRRTPPQDAQTTRFFVSPPDGWSLTQQIVGGAAAPNPLTVSPDGRRVAFLATGADDKSLLWIRSLDALTAQQLAGTDGASSPFWSPDSRFLGFFASGKLKKIEVSGGPPITLCDALGGVGGTWSQDGVIVFAASGKALQRVSAAGGVPTALTVLSQGENGHARPFFLPDGQHFIYRTIFGGSTGPVYVASLATAGRKSLLTSDSTNVLYTQGHLLFLRETTLMAQPFDAKQLVLMGDAFPIAEQVQTRGNPASGVFSVSQNGVLAYQTGIGTAGSQLLWFDRTGKQVGVLGDSVENADLKLSLDGKEVGVSILDQTGTRDIWLYDVARALKTRFTFGPGLAEEPTWSPDGSRIVFNSNRKGHYDLYQKAASGAGAEEVLFEDNLEKFPVSWSPDGRFILYVAAGGPTGNDLFVLPLSGDRPSTGSGPQAGKPFPFLQTQFNEGNGQFSPDGHWVAYTSNESGRNEVYVAPFPGPGGKSQISTSGGGVPRWSRDEKEIFYLALDNKLMAAEVNGKGASFDVGAVKPLFQTRVIGQRYEYDVSTDSQRFLINSAPEQQAAQAPITVVLNWTAGLKK